MSYTSLYFFDFSRVVILITFSLSLANKVFKVKAFENTVINFNLIPQRTVKISAYLIIICEASIFVTMCIAGDWLFLGFILSSIVLVVFTSALIIILLTNRANVSCNCFSTSDSYVSLTDVFRNIGLLLCSLYGCAYTITQNANISKAESIHWVAVIFTALIYVVILLQLKSIVRIIKYN